MMLAADRAACEDDRVAPRDVTRPHLATLVDHLFDQVLDAAERAELLTWIEAWEAENPDVDNAHRITGWIDVAYTFQAHAVQARLNRVSEVGDRSRWVEWPLGGVAWGAATA
jgi:hypothetical protein